MLALPATLTRASAAQIPYHPAPLNNPEPILDYASPRKRSKMRMPSKSALTWRQHPGGIHIVESLAADTGPVVTVLIAVALMFLASVGVWAMNAAVDPRRGFEPASWSVPAGLHAVEFVVALMVIQQTWRRTELRVSLDQMELLFWSPFRRRVYRWQNNDVLAVSFAPDAEISSQGAIGELLIVRSAGGPVHLFTDHLTSYLAWVAAAVESYLRTGRPPAELSVDDDD